LLADRHENLRAELVRPRVQEGQRTVEGDVRVTGHTGGVVGDLLGQRGGAGAGGGVAGAVAGQHVQLGDAGVLGERVLVHAESIRVGEVVGELAHLLEDVAIARVVLDRDLGLERGVGDVGGAREGSRVGLGQEGWDSGGSWAWVKSSVRCRVG